MLQSILSLILSSIHVNSRDPIVITIESLQIRSERKQLKSVDLNNQRSKKQLLKIRQFCKKMLSVY